MNVWVRISAYVDSEGHGRNNRASVNVWSGCTINIYRTKELAEKEKATHGGILLEVAAASLRGQSIEGANDAGHEEVVLYPHGIEDEGPSGAFLTVVYGDLPHTNEDRPEGVEFLPEAHAWLEELEKETGFLLHQ